MKKINIHYLQISGHNWYPASRGFSLVFLSVVLPFSSRFWLLAFSFGCFCAKEKTSADSRLGFLLSMRFRYLQDLGGNHMTKPVVEPVLSINSLIFYVLVCCAKVSPLYQYGECESFPWENLLMNT